MNQDKIYQVIVAPHISEKGTRQADKHRQYVFTVLRTASKPEIREAVEKLFNVQVDCVSTTRVKGKFKRHGRFTGYRQDWKKAYVTLKEGHDLKFLRGETV